MKMDNLSNCLTKIIHKVYLLYDSKHKKFKNWFKKNYKNRSRLSNKENIWSKNFKILKMKSIHFNLRINNYNINLEKTNKLLYF
jgi:hypothetical protein